MTLEGFLLMNFVFISGIILIFYGISKFTEWEKRSSKPVRPICEYCRHVALDERELYNHQLVCEKKKEKSKNS